MLIFAFLFVCVHLSAQYLCGAVLSELTCTRESFCIHVLHVTMSLDGKTARHQKNAALIKALDDIFEEILLQGCTGTAVGVLRHKANISVGQRFGINLMEYMILHRQTSLGYGSSKWENMH